MELSKDEHEAIRVHTEASGLCRTGGCAIGDGVYMDQRGDFTWGDACFCLGSVEICKKCMDPWPCRESR